VAAVSDEPAARHWMPKIRSERDLYMTWTGTLKTSLKYLTTFLLIIFVAHSLDEVIDLKPHFDFQPTIEEYERLQPLIRDYKMVGFVTDTTDRTEDRNAYLIQYAIAPVLLNTDDPHCCDVIVGYFVNSAPPQDYEIIGKVGENLFLLTQKVKTHESE
jgi:hypothetical protein